MLCSFTTRFRNFIWFLIFTFTLYCMPHLDLLFPYEFHFFFPEAEAAEAQEEVQAETQEQPQTQPSAAEEAVSSKETSATATAAAMSRLRIDRVWESILSYHLFQCR